MLLGNCVYVWMTVITWNKFVPDLFFQYLLYNHHAPNASSPMQMIVPKIEPATAPPQVALASLIFVGSVCCNESHKSDVLHSRFNYTSIAREAVH